LGDLLQESAFATSEPGVPPAKNVIMIFLTGGPSTIDMWDLKPQAPAAIRGEFCPIDTSVPGIQICEYLTRMAAQMQHVSLVRSMTHTIAEHTQGQAYVMTGNRPSPAFGFPSLGSLAVGLQESTADIPIYMTLGTVPSAGAGELEMNFAPFEASIPDLRNDQTTPSRIGLPSGFTITDLDRRRQVLERLDGMLRDLDAAPLLKHLAGFQRGALEILRSNKIQKALAAEDEPESQRTSYGQGFVGRSALAARRLVETGARFVTIGFGDWDTHNNNFTRLRTTLLPKLDQALAALLADFSRSRLLDETIVYCTGEFGRTPGINSSAGRDHWSRTMTCLLAGEGFRKGFAFGATNHRDGSEPTQSPCSSDDVSATIFRQLGFEADRQVVMRTERPIAIFSKGKVINPLIA
jgi:hypothetical protein